VAALHEDNVIVVDFGAQYSQLIARRVRESGVHSEIVPHGASLRDIMARRPRGIILSGGPSSVYQEGAPTCNPGLFELGVPVLGICYGLQLMCHILGGRVVRGDHREYGRALLHVDETEPLFTSWASGGPRQVWMSHGDLVLDLPPGFRVMAHTGECAIAAAGDPSRALYGLQFHPEVSHTDQGRSILEGFLFGVCQASPTWTMSSFIESNVEEIRRKVQGPVISALSGGVDSSVSTVLVHRAVGENLTSIFVDHGLLRKGESSQVIQTFRERLGMRLVHVDARERFLRRLEGVTDPEAKRKIIGEQFIRVFEEEARKTGGARYLVQGTLYPDVIESGTATAALIKSHHNVGGLPEDMELELVEPLRDLFKDEVRALGTELGLPAEIVWRQPFPGPGLAVRIIGSVTPESLELVRAADAIVQEEITGAGLGKTTWQFFAVLTGLKSVGVMGDDRTYANTVAVRAVTSEDAMTADWARLPLELLGRISSRIVGEVPGVNRVVYDITSKPPATIEWE
jgi:GMP synthase (glutamine-hydrolysing)